MEPLKIEYLGVDELTPYERNARKHETKDIDAIVSSINEFGFDDPIGIWGDRNVIVEGHGRLIAAKKIGMEKVPVIRLDHLTDEQRRAYALAHNRSAELSSWDEIIKEDELKNIFSIDMSLFGFEKVEDEVVEDNFTPEVPKYPMARVVDVYILGRHRIMCGDSTNINDVEKLMDGKKADMLLTDPPYNVNVEESAGKIINDNMKKEEFVEFLTSAFHCAKSNLKPGAAFHIWHASTTVKQFIDALENNGLKLRQVLVWVKNQSVLGRQDFQWQHEPCIAGFSEEETEDLESVLYGWTDGTHHWYKKRKEKTVLYYDKPTCSKEHPTMKPVLLFDYEMKCNTQPGDAVLDLFGGSGTTIIAAEQNGRDAFVMEYDPRFVDVIIDRWEKFTGQSAIKVQ